MTTRNFRVHNGISVGDIVIDAATNKITGGSTAAPIADGDFANKKYVDDTATAADLDFQGDTGGALSIDLDSEALTFTGGTGINTSGAGNAVTFAIDSTVTTLTGSQTLTNKTLTSPVLNGTLSGTAFLDEDTLSSNSATAVASQQSIKAYIDNGLSSLSSTTLTAGNTTAVVSDSGSDGAFTVTADGNTELVINDTAATFSGNVVISGNLTTNGTTVTNSSTNTTIEDALIELGSGNTGSNTNDLGLILERGSTGNNGFMGWDESEDKFIVGTTTGTGASTGNLTITTGTLVANIEGNVTGNVTGNTSGTAATVTGAAQTAITSVGTLTALQVDNLNVNGNTISSTAGTDLNITPLSGQQIVLDGTIVIDAGVVTGATSITSTAFVGDLTGTATAAQYSDVAERFASDSAYTPGTVVALGGAEEITQVNEEGSDEVFGVVSSLDQAAFKMNGGAGNDETHPYIAMTGRVDVKVIGTVNKGDRLISASVPGYARAATKAECTAFNVIGRALTGKTEAGQGTVLAAVRVSH